MSDRWSKETLKEIVEALLNLREIVKGLMLEISEEGERIRFNQDFRSRLKELKDFFKEENRRLESNKRSLAIEVSAFYEPAIRGALIRYPNLNAPRSWNDKLYEVSSDLNHYIFNAKPSLQKVENG